MIRTVEQKGYEPVCLSMTPIPQKPITHAASILAPLRYDPKATILANFDAVCAAAVQQFSSTGERTQLILADNSGNRAYGSLFVELNRMIKYGAIPLDFTPLNVYIQGKPHGLNACLTEATGDIVVASDWNKKPLGDAINQLIQEARGQHALVGAKILGLDPRHAEKQYLAYGGGYACPRDLFPPASPPGLIADDLFVNSWVNMQGGKIYISEAEIEDTKAITLSARERAERKGRQLAGNEQFQRLIVRNTNSGKSFRPVEHLPTAPERPIRTLSERIMGSIFLRGLTTEQKLRVISDRVVDRLKLVREYEDRSFKKHIDSASDGTW
ncbi:MAG: hypothetical protein U0525_05640 [Patescibacteria group bacterium]